jgi:hypothetical protein
VRDGGTGVRQQQIVEAARAILEAYGQDGLTMRRLAEALRPSVLEVVPGRTLRWLGHLLLPGIFDGEHHFEIEPLGGNPLHARAAGTVLRAASAAVSKEPGRALGGRHSSHECRAQGAGGSARRRARGAPARVLALTLPAPAAQRGQCRFQRFSNRQPYYSRISSLFVSARPTAYAENRPALDGLRGAPTRAEAVLSASGCSRSVRERPQNQCPDFSELALELTPGLSAVLAAVQQSDGCTAMHHGVLLGSPGRWTSDQVSP